MRSAWRTIPVEVLGGGRADLEAAGVDEAHHQRLAAERREPHRLALSVGQAVVADRAADRRLAFAQRALFIERGERGRGAQRRDEGTCPCQQAGHAFGVWREPLPAAPASGHRSATSSIAPPSTATSWTSEA